jgi:hypothetical protein
MKISELLTDEGKWTKGALARKSNGNICSPNDSDAVKWDLLGAAIKCHHDDLDSIIGRILKSRNLNKYSSIARWNDLKETSFEDVLVLVKDLEI